MEVKHIVALDSPSSGTNQKKRKTRPHTHCFISWTPVQGGSSAAHHEYARALARAGHPVTIVGRGEAVPYYAEENLFIHPIRDGVGHETLAHISFLMAVVRHLREHRYDFVDAFLSPGISILPLLAGRSNKVKWVLHIRTSSTDLGWRGSIKNFMARTELEMFNAVTIIDHNIAPQLFISGRKCQSFLELPLGINPERLISGSDERLALFGNSVAGKMIIIYVGKTDASRFLVKMIEAFALVKRQFENAVLVVVGSGDHEGKLDATAHDWNVSESIIFCGQIEYSQVSRYISSADLALTYIPMNRTYQWQPALKALEYLQMGLPQVATATNANKKYVEHEVNGLLASDDPELFAGAVLRLLEDRLLYEKVRKDCTRGIEQHYWGSITEQRLIPFYEKLLSVR